MTTTTGVLVALLVAWASVLIATRVPITRLVTRRQLKGVAGATLGTLGLILLGLPLPHVAPLVVLLGGLVLLTGYEQLAKARRRRPV